MNYDNYYKNGGMTKEETISAIAMRIGARKEAVEKFVEENTIDAQKLNSDLKSGKVYFMDIITAIVGKPNNKYQKEIIKKYGSKMAMGGKTQGYDDREDERLSMEHGKIADKDFVASHERREHSRRDDARFEERMARGGYVSKEELVWKKLTKSERMKFLQENFTPEITPRSQFTLVGKDYNFLPKNVKIAMESKYANVEDYADGGMMAEEGEVGDKVYLLKGLKDENIFRNFPEGEYEIKKIKKGTESFPEGFYEIENKDGRRTILKKSRFALVPSKGFMANGGMMARGGKIYEKEKLANITYQLINTEDSFKKNNPEEYSRMKDEYKSQFIKVYGEDEYYKRHIMADGGMMAKGGEEPLYDSAGFTREDDSRIIIKSGNNGKLKQVFNEYKNQKNELKANEIFDNERMNGKSVFLFVNDDLYDQYIQESDVDEYAKGGYMADGGLTKEKLVEIQEEFEENEDDNYHSENVILLARYFGTKEDLKDARDIWKKHKEEGFLSGENYKKRFELAMKLFDKFDEAKKEAGLMKDDGMMAKGGEVSDREILNYTKQYNTKRYNTEYAGRVLGFPSKWDKSKNGNPIIYFTYFDDDFSGRFMVASGVFENNTIINATDVSDAVFENEFDALRYAYTFSTDENFDPDYAKGGMMAKDLLNYPKTLIVNRETSVKGNQFKRGDIVSVQYQFDDDDESFYMIKGYGENNQNVKILYIPKKEMDNFLRNTSLYLNEAKGGAIKNQYKDRTAKDIWESWSDEQKIHFFTDHKQHPYYNMGDEKFVVSKNDREKYVGMSYDDLPRTVRLMISDHVEEGEYAKGGAIQNQYEDRTPQDIWDSLDSDQRYHFIDDHALQIEMLQDENYDYNSNEFPESINIDLITKSMQSDWKDLDEAIQNRFANHVRQGEYAKGGKLESGVYRIGKPKKVDENLYVQKIVEIFDDGSISTASDYGRKLNDFKSQKYPVITQERFEEQYKYAKGGAITKNKWDYTDVDDIEYVIVKDKNGKELRFAGKYVLSGVHDLLAKGGKLSEKGKYYSKDNVVSVVVDGKNIIDKNTVSGVWIMKDAKPMAEDVVEMKIGKTTIKKGHYGWVGKTMVENFKGYDWDITTIKNYNGDLSTTAQGGKNKKEDGYSSFSFMMFQDPNIRLKSSRPARVTDKVVSAQHEEALKEFKEKQEEIAQMVDQIQAKKKMADGGAIGFDALAKKVAKNYEGDKVKKQYQNQYGKTYDKKEAEEVGKKVAAKVYRQQQANKGKMKKGGTTEHYRQGSKLAKIASKAKEIRKENEPWKDAFNRAKAMIG